MTMKIRLLFLVIVIISASHVSGQKSDNCVTKTLLTAFSEREYSSEPVEDYQLDLILKCGIKAPSGRNKQPWRFTVFKDETAMKEIIRDAIPGNVLIVVSGIESESGTTPDFDCGLAVENMYIAAHGLGLGARIYGGAVGNINSQRERFQIPEGYKAVKILRVGHVSESVDAVTAASPRMAPEEIINYYKSSD